MFDRRIHHKATSVRVDFFVMFKWIKIFLLLLIAHHFFDLWSLAICDICCALYVVYTVLMLYFVRCYCFIDEMCECSCQSSSLSPWFWLKMIPLPDFIRSEAKAFLTLLFNFLFVGSLFPFALNSTKVSRQIGKKFHAICYLSFALDDSE